MSERVLESIRFPEPRTFRGACEIARQALAGHTPAACTGVVLIECPDSYDRIYGLDLVYRPSRQKIDSVESQHNREAAQAYHDTVLAPRERLREQAAEAKAERQAEKVARKSARKAASETAPKPEPLPTDEQIEAAAVADAKLDTVLRPVHSTPRAIRERMTANERRADTLARAKRQQEQFAVVLAARKEERTADRSAKVV